MKYPAVVINVPGSLVQPGLTRKEAFLAQWERSGLGEQFELTFLENACTPAEIVHDLRLLTLAKKHDTFIQPGLRKALLGFDSSVTLTAEQKAATTVMVEAMITHLWTPLINILIGLNFSCQDKEAIALNSLVGNPDVLAGLLDAVRTKLTRTACTESHLRAYRKLHESRHSSSIGLLLEDDLVILPQAATQIEHISKYLSNYQPNWNTVQMGWSKLEDRPNYLWLCHDAPLATSENNAYGNTAVLLNLAHKGASQIVDLIERHRATESCIVANDVIMAEDRYGRYLAWPRYIGPPIGNHLSVIVGKSMDYTRFCWDPEQVEQIKALQ
jgi:GR25 family glycosyltransferase involved in LPS biosynthesis